MCRLIRVGSLCLPWRQEPKQGSQLNTQLYVIPHVIHLSDPETLIAELLLIFVTLCFGRRCIDSFGPLFRTKCLPVTSFVLDTCMLTHI